jgi:hypothetical protein
MSTKVKRPGSGRTKGSFSFVKVPLSTLVAKFADQSTPIVISRKYAETIGLQGLTAAPAGSTLDSIEGKTPNTAVTAQVHDLDKI